MTVRDSAELARVVREAVAEALGRAPGEKVKCVLSRRRCRGRRIRAGALGR